tara:strand:+ start:7044 stop:7436 length:393 start_codon:yes stop_codon:yes gene_type:complete
MSYYDRDKADAQPSMKWPRPHFGSVAEYQVSPWPYIVNVIASQTNLLVDFSSVTRWITIHAIGDTCTISFASGGAAFTVPVGVLVRLELKCTKIFVTTPVAGTCSIIAGVTSIDDTQFPDISARPGVVAP